MRPPSLPAVSAVLLAFALAAAPAVAQPAAVTRHPLAGAPYGAAATVSPYAAKVFLGGADQPDAASALRQLAGLLATAGLGPGDLVHVRASLARAADGSLDTRAWNEAWAAFFAGQDIPPARTTLATDAVAGGPDWRARLEAVAAALPGTGAFGQTRASALHPRLRLAAGGPMGASAVAVVLPGTPLLLTAGLLADPANPAAPERTLERFGPMAAQARSALAKVEATIAPQGFRREDIFYVRALLSPPEAGAAVDFGGFAEAFAEFFMRRHPDLCPVLALAVGPGFSANGQLVEVEAYAAAAEPRGPFDGHDLAAARPWVEFTGAETSQISSSAAVARHRAMTWFSGVLTPDGAGDLHDGSVGALLTLRARLTGAGHSLGDVLTLRCYPVVGTSFRANLALWNEAYGRFFNHAQLNPLKPARTSFPLSALPRGAANQIEVIAVGSAP